MRRQRVVLGYTVMVGPTKTANGSGREVPLDVGTVAALRSWRTRLAAERLSFGPGYADSGYVFVDEDGQPTHPERIGKTFARLVKATGLRRVRLHDSSPRLGVESAQRGRRRVRGVENARARDGGFHHEQVRASVAGPRPGGP